MARSGQARLDSIQPAIERGNAFLARVEGATSAPECAALMAEAIAMNRDARGLEAVGRDGRRPISMEELQSDYCMDAAREAFLRLSQTPEPTT